MTRRRHHFSVEVSALEIARGHDGFLRGKPEPVVILACYVLDGDKVRPMGRSLYRFGPSKAFPSHTQPVERSAIAVRVDHDKPVCFAMIAIALEEDGGRDVRRVYGATDGYRSLSIWSADLVEPSPLGLDELAAHQADWLAPRSVQLIVDGSDLASSCTSDQLVGAVAWVVPAYRHPLPIRREARNEFRLHFQSADGRNDWTALALVEQ